MMLRVDLGLDVWMKQLFPANLAEEGRSMATLLILVPMHNSCDMAAGWQLEKLKDVLKH